LDIYNGNIYPIRYIFF